MNDLERELVETEAEANRADYEEQEREEAALLEAIEIEERE